MDHNTLSFSDFIASTIHDLKNALMMQGSALQALAARCQRQGDAQTAAELGALRFEAQRMNAHLVQLLGIYKFDKDIYPLDIDEHPVRELLQECVLQDQSSLDFKGITAQIDCPADLRWYLDRDLVTGIVLNALSNAHAHARGQVRLSAQVTDAGLEVRIEDNGAGFPQSMLDQLALETRREMDFTAGHTGLGLFFSQRAARLHRNGARVGAIALENGGRLGGGCFVVTLP